MNKRIELYYKIIDQMNLEIKEVQDKCPHDKGFTEGIQIPGGSVLFCNECNYLKSSYEGVYDQTSVTWSVHNNE